MRNVKILGAFVAAAVVGGVGLFALKNKSSGQRTLHLYTWTDYIDKQVLAEFERKHNVRVIEETFPSNEVMISKLKAGGAGFDVIVPSDYMIATMKQDNLLLKLPREKIPNLTHLSERFKNVSYDAGGEYVVPYMWGTTGIAYNSKKVENPPKSWKEFFETTRAQTAEKRISLLDDPREVIGAALKANGLSLNSTQTEELSKAKMTLLTFKPFVSRFDTMSYKDLLASDDLWMAQAYSGDIVKMQAQNPELRYVIPEDGATLWVDNLAIPVSARNPELAAEFINFVMAPEINQRIALSIHYGTTNEKAREMLPASELNNAAIYPPKDVEARLELFTDLGNAVEAVDNVWAEIRASDAVPAEPPSAQRQ
ncbi:MAG: spermidine/putrescine ABC transporter substrate-binding protein [Betaproteobacteria bacterium]|nr:spermidine/putrescine ABC transporter substrate-binding protein [Betaproteobacteria bacterium]